jgi:hypothetical protein
LKHPVVLKEINSGEIRKEIADILTQRYDLVRHDTIVFVCGGNKSRGARKRFLKIASKNLTHFDFFMPEYSVVDGPVDLNGRVFNIALFEELVAKISYAVVLFPEGPGSYCETGYFATKGDISYKTILALNIKYENEISFISTGPLHLYNKKSRFGQALYTDYKGTFENVISKLESYKSRKSKKAIDAKSYDDLNHSEKFGIIQKLIELLRMATEADIIYMFRSIFSGVKTNEIKELIAILMGSSYILNKGDYGHFVLNAEKESFLEIRTGYGVSETQLRLKIAHLISKSIDFNNVLLGVQDAA